MDDYESDYDYDDASSDGDYGILKKALDVELPENFDPTRVPQTGEEYLQSVIYERSKCKEWVTSDIDQRRFQHKQTFKLEIENIHSNDVPKHILPSREWQLQQLEYFTRFRNYIHSNFKSESMVGSFNKQLLRKANEGRPKFSEIASLSQSTKIHMIMAISDSFPEKITSFNANLGNWLYALLVSLEQPLSPDSCHNLRNFAKKCIGIRSNLPADAGEDLYVPLNLCICIVAKFFNQLDLADP